MAGRLVNGFSSRDWLLALIYRSKSWSVGVAGTARVEGCGVENIDLRWVGPFAAPRPGHGLPPS